MWTNRLRITEGLDRYLNHFTPRLDTPQQIVHSGFHLHSGCHGGHWVHQLTEAAVSAKDVAVSVESARAVPERQWLTKAKSSPNA